MISERLEKYEKKNVFYYTCNMVDNAKELVSIVTSYSDSVRVKRRRAYVFLDEVSSVKDWQKGIKHLADIGMLENVTMVLTGSHSIDVKTNSERLPGRRGSTNDSLDKIMLPMKFVEYVESVSPKLAKEIIGPMLLPWEVRRQVFTSLFEGEFEVMKEIVLYSKELQQLLGDYLLTGGIPRVVNEFKARDSIGEGVYKTYVDSVLGDLQRWGKRESYVRQILNRVFDTIGGPIGWNTLRKDTDIASHATVADYVDYVTDTFAMMYLHRLDINQKSPAYEKDKKIFLEDPFFFHSLRAWCKGLEPYAASLEYLKDERNVGYLMESIVANHLVRLSFSLSKQKQLFEYKTCLFYWRSNKDREVDFVMKAGESKFFPIELKYQRTISREDKFALIDFSKATGSTAKGVLLSKNDLRGDASAVIVPAWAFLFIV